MSISFCQRGGSQGLHRPRTAGGTRQIAKDCIIAVVKTGAGGSWIRRGEEVIKIDALKVKAVDTTGAGDLYAAVPHGYSHGFSLDKCGMFGSILAGKVIEVIGAECLREWPEAREMISLVAADQ